MNIFKRLIILAHILLIFLLPLVAQSNTRCSACLESIVTFDAKSLETVLLKPELILEDPDAFWKSDAAYTLAKRWHNNNNISLDTRDYYNTWIKHLEEINKLSEAERMESPSFQMMQDIIDLKNTFDSLAIPHICSFLPDNNVKLNTSVYLTGHTLAWAFMTNSQIVINLLHPHYDGKTANDFLNTITHEVFHIGYGRNRYYRTEIELENAFLYSMLDALHNEGMAVYMAYKAQDFFPSPDEMDNIMLENRKEVKRLRKELNELFVEATSLPADSLRKRAWELV